MRSRVVQDGEGSVDVRFGLMFPRESLSVPVMRRVLGDTLRRLGVDEDCIGDLLLAVTEACTNVLQHGGPTQRYEVVASISRSGCLVEVLDSGRGFNPGPGRRAADRAAIRHPRALPPPAARAGRGFRAVPGRQGRRADGAARRAQPVLPGQAQPGRRGDRPAP